MRQFIEYLKQFRGMLYFYFMGYVIRDFIPFIGTTVRVVTLIVLFLLIGGLKFLPHVIIGALVALVFGSGMSQLSVDINALTLSRFKYMVVSSPISPLVYAFGAAIGMSIVTLLQVIPLFILYLIIVKPSLSVIVVTVIVLLTLWIIGITMGFSVSLRIRSPIRLMSITDIIYSSLVYVMPVYYPMEVLPEYVRPITYISPATHAALILRSITGISSIHVIPLNWVILCMYLIIFTIIASCKAQWREK